MLVDFVILEENNVSSRSQLLIHGGLTNDAKQNYNAGILELPTLSSFWLWYFD